MGLTALFITHDMGVAKHVSDRIAVMYLGRIVELADREELFSHTMHPYTKALIQAIPIPSVEEKTDRTKLLEGEIPNPIHAPSGCPFRLRCPRADSLCAEEMPPMEERSPGHLVACCHSL